MESLEKTKMATICKTFPEFIAEMCVVYFSAWSESRECFYPSEGSHAIRQKNSFGASLTFRATLKVKRLKIWAFTCIYRRLEGNQNSSGLQCEVAY